MSTATGPEPIRCRDACGAAVDDEKAALDAAWSYLSIAAAWRCPACDRALRQAAAIVGTDQVTEDTLPADSRGALPRETASTIHPPTVR